MASSSRIRFEPDAGFEMTILQHEMDQLVCNDPSLRINNPLQATEPAPTAPNIAEDEYIYLHVANTQPEFAVRYGVLRRASYVWVNILHSHRLQRRRLSNQVQWVLDLPNDDYEAMSYLLNIIHGRTDLIPWKSTYSIGRIYKILVLTHKYAMTHWLRDCSAVWTTEWRAVLFKDTETLRLEHGIPSPSTLGMVMWMAWELGDEGLFKAACAKIAMFTCVSDEGRFVSKRMLQSEGYILSDCFSRIFAAMGEEYYGGSEDIIDLTRKTMLHHLLTPIYDALMLDPSGAFACLQKDASPECQTQCCCDTAGRVLRHLQHSQLWPIVDTEKIRISPNMVMEKLRYILVNTSSKARKKCIDQGHDKCAAQVGIFCCATNDLDALLYTTIDLTMGQKHRDYMDAKAANSGVAERYCSWGLDRLYRPIPRIYNKSRYHGTYDESECMTGSYDKIPYEPEAKTNSSASDARTNSW